MNEDTFLDALRDDPADEVTWLALADWLTDNGQSLRGELLRLSLRLRATPIGEPEVRQRVAALLAADVKPVIVERTNSIRMRFTLVPRGRFLMGSPDDEDGRKGDEPLHEVQITKPFWLGVFPVTQGQWKAVTSDNPSAFRAGGLGGSADFPVEQTSWEDAQGFLQRLGSLEAEKAGRWEYRLPTEAEWEYACRGGGISQTPFCTKTPSDTLSSTQANFDGNHPYGDAPLGPYLARTCPAGSYEPNPLGIYDMHGNVLEWCSDWYGKDYYVNSPPCDPAGPPQGTNKVFRGGSWDNVGSYCRAANRLRSWTWPVFRRNYLGFRAVLVVN